MSKITIEELRDRHSCLMNLPRERIGNLQRYALMKDYEEEMKQKQNQIR